MSNMVTCEFCSKQENGKCKSKKMTTVKLTKRRSCSRNQEDIKKIEEKSPFDNDIKEYREAQLKFLREIIKDEK